MIDPSSSRVDWKERFDTAEVDLEEVWKNDSSLELPVGDSAEEKLIDAIFQRGEREHELETLRIVPIRDIKTKSRREVIRLVNNKMHMIQSRLWELIMEFYKKNKSLKGFNPDIIMEGVRQEIHNALPDDVFSREVYEESLLEGMNYVLTILATGVAASVFESLDPANKEIAIQEANEAFVDGKLESLNADNDVPTQDEIVIAYIEYMIDVLVGNIQTYEWDPAKEQIEDL